MLSPSENAGKEKHNVKYRTAQKNLERLLNWIRAADSKIAPVLAIDTAMAGILATLFTKVTEHTWYTMLLFLAVAVLLGLSILFLAFAAFPRTEGPKGSILYFGGIVTFSRKAYTDTTRNLKTEDYFEDLSAQCHRNAEIANIKYIWVCRAMKMLFCSILPWLVAVCILYGAYNNGRGG